MRLLVLDQSTDIRALATRLPGASSVDRGAAALARVRALNPHIAGLKTLARGTVVVLPDPPPSTTAPADTGQTAGSDTSTSTGSAETTGQPVGADTFDALASAIIDGLANAAKRMASGLAGLKTAQGDLQTAVKTDVVRRAVAADPLLKQQLADVDKQLAQDQEQAQAGIASVKAMQEGAGAELALLRKLLG